MIWITRGSKPLLNRDTGQYATGGYSSLVEGPDEISDSAMNFDGSKKLTIPINTEIDGDFTIQFGFKIST